MSQNIDTQELEKFSTYGDDWWNPEGKLKTLHRINPVRLSYIEEKIDLAGKKIIDIGCGGGILTESLAKKGAVVTGIDADLTLIEIAKKHQLISHLEITYIQKTAEAMAEETSEAFDVVTALELLEHVPDPASIIMAPSKLLKPGGALFLSTINRTLKAYLLAIIGAEYILHLIPRGTHDYAKFIRPSELRNMLSQAALIPKEIRGLFYSPFGECHLTDDPSVNYLFYAVKP